VDDADHPADANRPPDADQPDEPGRPEDAGRTGNRRAFLGLLAGGAAVAAGGVVVWRVFGQDPPPVAATPTSTTAPPQLRVTTSTLPPLPVPDPLPENPHADTPQIVIGTIELPRIGVTADIQEGITLTAINRGPGHWPHTAMPGALGNVVIAGHRTTYSKPFNRLNELQPGDRVTMTTADGRFDYEVRGIVIVPGEAVDIATQSYAHTATLFACHPPGSARQRIVAKLRLLDAAGRPVDPDSALPPIDAGSQETDHSLVVRAGPDPLTGSGT
jgi:LPXTG-site transpeptidase (sortase) family protein